MKKIISVFLAAVMCCMLFAGCGKEKQEGVYDIAIVQQLDHPSLEEIRIAVEARLDEIAEEKGISIRHQVFNGQNDPAILGQIGAQVTGGFYDCVIPIATLAAQYVVSAAEGTELPIVFAAISDPNEAGLVGLANVTGTADALNTGMILDMMLAADPDVKTVGLLYSNSEPNSALPIAQAKQILEDRGIEYLDKTGNTADEVLTAASALVGRVDAVFTPTDNAVMNVAAGVADILNENGIPHYTGADSFVQAGAFATCGINYTDLGRKTADMAADLMLTGACPDYHVMDGGIIVYNTDTAQKLHLDGGVFETMTDTVIPVTN